MSIDQAELLKRELTDKWVVVAEGVPELRRFAGFNGRVKTVNMNCRALVQFDGSEDIGWYDIDPGYLTVISEPRKKEAPKAVEKAAPKPAPKPVTGGASPLDLIRQGGAAKPAAATGGTSPLDLIRKGAAAKPASDGGEKKLSPLDMIRKSAGKPTATEAPAPATVPAAAAPVAAAPEAPTEDLSKLSPIEQIRRRAAAKK